MNIISLSYPWLVGSFILWMMMDAVKPGVVQHWWDLRFHFWAVVMATIFFLRAAYSKPSPVEAPTPFLVRVLSISGVFLIVLVLTWSWGIAGVLLALTAAALAMGLASSSLS